MNADDSSDGLFDSLCCLASRNPDVLQVETRQQLDLHVIIIRVVVNKSCPGSPKYTCPSKPGPDSLECVSLITHPDPDDGGEGRSGDRRGRYQPDSLSGR